MTGPEFRGPPESYYQPPDPEEVECPECGEPMYTGTCEECGSDVPSPDEMREMAREEAEERAFDMAREEGW